MKLKFQKEFLEYAHINDDSPGAKTSQPEVQEEQKTENPFDVGYEGDRRVLKPGAAYGTGKFEETMLDKQAEKGVLTEGPSPDPKVLELSPAQKAARRMEKIIHDQIEVQRR